MSAGLLRNCFTVNSWWFPGCHLTINEAQGGEISHTHTHTLHTHDEKLHLELKRHLRLSLKISQCLCCVVNFSTAHKNIKTQYFTVIYSVFENFSTAVMMWFVYILLGFPLPEGNVILFLFLFLFLADIWNRKSDITLCPLDLPLTFGVNALSQVSISGI